MKHRTTRLATLALATLGVVAAVTQAPAALATDGPTARAKAKAARLAHAPAALRQPGAGAPPAGFASWAEVMKVQDRLDRAADRIVAANGAGYAGIVVSAQKNQVTLYYKGRPSARAKAAIAAAGKGVTVKVVPAAHTRATLIGEAHRLARKAGVTSVSPKADGSGLQATVATASARSLVSRRLVSSVPTTVQQSVAAPQLASRGDDYAPYWGGARWNGCSTGFAVRVGANNHMLTAGHCGSQWQSAYDGGGQYMGYIYGDDNAHDRQLITATSAGRIYDGGVGTGEFSKPVIGALHSYVGDWLCTSGAYSGARCGIQVKSTGVTLNIGYLVYDTVRAEQVDHTNAIGNGDSGGPVFSLAWFDYNKVYAKGTNTAIDTTTSVPCTGVPAGPGRTCAWRMYYVDVVNSLNAYGATIVTG